MILFLYIFPSLISVSLCTSPSLPHSLSFSLLWVSWVHCFEINSSKSDSYCCVHTRKNFFTNLPFLLLFYSPFLFLFLSPLSFLSLPLNPPLPSPHLSIFHLFYILCPSPMLSFFICHNNQLRQRMDKTRCILFCKNLKCLKIPIYVQN